MRTLLAGERATIQGAVVNHYLKVEVQDADGTWKDWSAYTIGAQWGEHRDQPVASASISLRRAAGNSSLAPLMEASPLNVDGMAVYAPAIDIGRLVRLSTGTTAAGGSPSYREMFTGRVDDVAWEQDPIVLQCSDLGAFLMDTQIELERTYWSTDGITPGSGSSQNVSVWFGGALAGATTVNIASLAYPLANGTVLDFGGGKTATLTAPAVAGDMTLTVSPLPLTLQPGDTATTVPGSGSLVALPVETVIQQILADNPSGVTSPPLYTPSSPGWNINAFAQSKVKVLEAVRALALQIGWDLRHRYDASHASVLTLMDPDRSSGTVAATIGPTEYRDVRRLSLALADVRNAASVTWFDTAGIATTTTVENATSIAKYGRRWMELETGDNIDTSTEADLYINAVVDDLSYAPAEQEVDLLYFWPVQLYDRYTFTQNGVHYDVDQTLSVVGYQHTFENGHGVTTLSCAGRVVGAYTEWLRRQVIPNDTTQVFGDIVIRGPGQPDGVISASIGTLYQENNSVSGPALWSKTTNTGLTGWRPLKSSDNIVNILDHHAVEDGATDDYPAITAAIAECAADGGGIVYVPSGRYGLQTQVELLSGVSLQGAGPSSVIIPSGMAEDDAIVGVGVSNVTVDSLWIEGDGGAEAMAFGLGFTGGGDHITISSVWVSGANGGLLAKSGGGIRCEEIDDLTITRCRLFGNGTGGAADVYFTGASQPTFADMWVNGGGAQRSINCRIKENDCESTDVHFNILTFNLWRSAITGNHVTGARTNTTNHASGYGIACYRVTNVLYGTVGAVDCSDNVVHDVEGTAIYGQSLVGFTAHRNRIERYATVQDDTTLAVGGVVASDCVDVSLVGNRIKDGEMAGICLSSNGGITAVGTGTVTCTAGSATFSATQLHYLVNGYGIQVGATTYTLSAFNGTTGGTLSGSPTFGASAFTIVVPDSSGRTYVVSDYNIEDVRARAGISLRGTLRDVQIGKGMIRAAQFGIRTINEVLFENVQIGGAVIKDSESGPAIFMKDVDGGGVKDCDINGTASAQAGIQAVDCTFFDIDENALLATSGNGIEVGSTGATHTVQVRNNKVFDGGTFANDTYAAIYLNAPDLIATGNHVGNFGPTGYKYGIQATTNAINSAVTSNKSYGAVTADWSVPADLSYNIVFGGNHDHGSSGVFGSPYRIGLTGNPTGGLQYLIGGTPGAVQNSLGSQYSGADLVLGMNAVQTYNADQWSQPFSTAGSSLMRFRLDVVGVGATRGEWQFFHTAAGVGAGTFAAFWGSPVFAISTTGKVVTGEWESATNPIKGQWGGTGVANTGKTITIGGDLTVSGAFTCTLTVTGNTTVTLPTTGTLLTSADWTSAATASKGVVRDASGDFAAHDITAHQFNGPLVGNVTGNVSGNASTASAAGALSVASQTVTGAGSSAALHDLIAKLNTLGANLTDSTTP